MSKIYGKVTGHHCFWLTINGKSVAHFDDEADVDAIIKLDADLKSTTAKLSDTEKSLANITKSNKNGETVIDL